MGTSIFAPAHDRIHALRGVPATAEQNTAKQRRLNAATIATRAL